LEYSTYVGGFGEDRGFDITLDDENNAYVTGMTDSTNFPTTSGCYDETHNREVGQGEDDAFVFKLNSDGSDLVYSTYVGGNDYDTGYRIVVDSENNAYVTGYTNSNDFPTTTGCYDSSYKGHDDVFVFKMNADGSDIMYSTYFGGSESDDGYGITLDHENCVYITGYTYSDDLPTTSNCYDASLNGHEDIFICKFNPEGSELVYSTYIGGEVRDWPYSIAIDSENNVYVAGWTESSDFPTTYGCYDDSYNGEEDVFVCKLNANGTNLVYSTYIGGSDDDIGVGGPLDSENNAYVTGYTYSSDFPTTQGCYSNTHNGECDIFIVKLNSEGTDLHYSSLLGGTNWDAGHRIAIDINNNVYITGISDSMNFPTTSGCYDDSNNGDEDFIVCKLNLLTPIIDVIYPNPALKTDNIHFRGYGMNGIIERYVWRSDINGEFYNSSHSEYNYSGLSIGNHTIYLKLQDDNGYWSDEVNTTLIIHEKPIAHIDSISPKPSVEGVVVRFSGHGTDDGEITCYCWISNLDGEVYNDTHSTCLISSLSIGEHTISFKVQDNHGAWSDEISMSLKIYPKPTAEILSISPNPATSMDAISFIGQGTSQGSIEKYVWSSSVDNEIYNGIDANFKLLDLSIGTYTISLKVQDEYGFWSEEVTTTLTVTEYQRENEIPSVTLLSPLNYSEVSGEVQCSGRASDEDGEIEKVEISFDGGLWIPVQTTAFWTYNWDSKAVENGVHTISVRSYDGEDYSDEVSITVTANNAEEKDETEWYEEPVNIGGLATVIIVVVIVVAILFMRKRNAEYYEEWSEYEDSDEGW